MIASTVIDLTRGNAEDCSIGRGKRERKRIQRKHVHGNEGSNSSNQETQCDVVDLTIGGSSDENDYSVSTGEPSSTSNGKRNGNPCSICEAGGLS